MSHHPLRQQHENGSHVTSCGWKVYPLVEEKKVQRKMHEEDDSAVSPSRNSRILATRSFDVPDCDGTKEQSAKLCGYLNKLTGKGPLRGFKMRWFVYDPRKCYLYYFKTPQDALPLGHIEIADACFNYDVEVEEGLFEIHTEGKEFLLKVYRYYRSAYANKNLLHETVFHIKIKCAEFIALILKDDYLSAF